MIPRERGIAMWRVVAEDPWVFHSNTQNAHGPCSMVCGGRNMGMGHDAEIRIYCNYEQPGGIERVSLRLRDFLDRQGCDVGLVSAVGDRIFGETTERLDPDNLSGCRVIFSRKGDLRDIRGQARGARLIYWRHVPVAR